MVQRVVLREKEREKDYFFSIENRKTARFTRVNAPYRPHMNNVKKKRKRKLNEL